LKCLFFPIYSTSVLVLSKPLPQENQVIIIGPCFILCPCCQPFPIRLTEHIGFVQKETFVNSISIFFHKKLQNFYHKFDLPTPNLAAYSDGMLQPFVLSLLLPPLFLSLPLLVPLPLVLLPGLCPRSDPSFPAMMMTFTLLYRSPPVC
jgi:hypothetical protein